MVAGWFVILISLAYVGLLFAIAYYGDNHARELLRSRARPWVYSLSLAVYCTSWTFYGAVGRAATSGWEFLATYLGPILTFIFGWHLFTKIVQVSKQQNITTISDFIASRYGKSQSLAVLVTVLAVLGVVPYIALQLKAVALSYNTLTTSVGQITSSGSDTALFVALLMALFSILFGTRHIDATEHHEGMVLAVAFESIVKLAAFLAVGLFVTFGMFDGFGDLLTQANERLIHSDIYQDGVRHNSFLTEVLLAAIAVICLPRQFQMGVVENTHLDDLKTARWVFPLYLVLMCLFVLPIATAGKIKFPGAGIDADTFVLGLPLYADQSKLALLAFVGGLSAATSMVIVATISLSTMICNDIVMPLLLRIPHLRLAKSKDLGALLLRIRRLTIINLMLLAYFYYRIFGESGSLASYGLLAFAAVAQFAPAMVGAVYWKGGTRQGALAGLSAGFLFWLITLVLPTLADAGLLPRSIISNGLFGFEMLRPTALLGVPFSDPLTHGLFWSLLANIGLYLLFSRYSELRLIDRIQASTYVDTAHSPSGGDKVRTLSGQATVGDLQMLTERFLGVSRTQHAFTGFALQRGEDAPLSGDRATPELIEFTERLLAGVIGAASARIILGSTLRGQDMQLGDVVTIVDEASQVLQFNRSLLQSTIENISQGISVVDSQYRLVAWNRRYVEMFEYPEGLICVGRPAQEVFRFNAETGEYGPGDIDDHVLRRMELLRSGEPHSYERYRKDGSVLEVRGNPMPGGGYVNTYMDITEHKRVQEALRESEQSIRIYTDNVPVLIAYLDTDRRYLFVNKAYAEVFGIDRHRVQGTPCYKVLTQEEYQQRTPYIAKVLQGQRQSFETRLPTQDGNIRYADVTYIPHMSEHGDLLGYFTLYQDITQRRLAEIALQETNETLEQRVRERTQAISAINRELRKENTVRALMEDELRQAKSEAEEANLGKTRFLAAASHDLLQPLNAARLFASALGQQSHSQETSELVANLDGSLKAAEELLVALLDMSKLDAGALEPNLTDFPISSIFNLLSPEFHVLAKEKGLQFDCVSSRQVLRSDQQLLRRVLQNFLSNAIRYTQQGRILLGTRRLPGRLRIEVWDTGVGIPENKLKEVFEEFKRIDNPKHSQVNGLGLGLAITERIARMLDHPLQVRSWPGKGTVFSVEVPYGDPARVAASKPSSSRRGHRSSGLDGIRVLCIDNEPNILEGMSALLKGWSCAVHTALSEADALEQAAAGMRPDIILADYHLGETQTGIMALEALARHWETPVPAIVITADRTDAIQEEVAGFGAQLLHKPMKPAALRAMMTTLLAGRKR